MRTPGLLPSPIVPSEGLDLAALLRADLAVRDAAAEACAASIAERLADALAPVEPATAELVRRLVGELGRVEARAAAAMQAAEEWRRNRGDWIALDPLRELAPAPEPRPAPADRFEVNPADPDFQGFGWHDAEGQPGKGFRWSRQSIASVVLPSLGAGIIDLRLELMAPFGLPLRAADITLLHDGMPLAFDLLEEGRERTTLATRLVSGDEGGLGSLALILQGRAFEDPSGREKRGLGLGLHRIVAERA